MLVGLRVSLYQLQTLQVHSPVALDFFKPTAFPFVFRAARLPSALSNAAQVPEQKSSWVWVWVRRSSCLCAVYLEHRSQLSAIQVAQQHWDWSCIEIVEAKWNNRRKLHSK
jgi:hypothetical protein